METASISACTICGESGSGLPGQFLVVEDRWQDKLKILHWDARLAAVPGIHNVCGASHLRQLVVHWMTTGSVDHPFAQSDFRRNGYERPRSPRPPMELLDGGRARPIGELAVHRESMQRVLGERPESLQAILDTLLSALQRPPTREAKMRVENGARLVVLRPA